MEDTYFGWKQLSQWDVKPSNAHIEYKSVETGISKGICSFVLVKITVLDEGRIRHENISKDMVTPDMLKEAGNP